MEGVETLESEIKKPIVGTLALGDVDPQQVETDAELFGGRLGFDSTDALQCALVLKERYDMTIVDDPESNAGIFASVRSLADLVRTQVGEPGGGKD